MSIQGAEHLPSCEEGRIVDTSQVRPHQTGLTGNDDEPSSPNITPWLRSLLTAYPGSRHGNSETRGLDSEFALNTYVRTRLDDALFEEIESDRINLIILCGNAGDGKTAFLQSLAQRLGVTQIHSANRVWNQTLRNGRTLKVNLDGSAAWQGRSANELLDDILSPFHHEHFTHDRIHVLAINSGKLLEWIELQPEDTYLTTQLRKVLLGDVVDLDPRFRLIDLNNRSLVGGVDLGNRTMTTSFLDALLDRFLKGGETNPWQPCTTCTAKNRCTAWNSVQSLQDPDAGPYIRQRLSEVLQACHQRGEVHITARDLRGALSYIFFGVHDCSELHEDTGLQPSHFWQRIFDASSVHRQGELLGELARFDPALESDPVIDRALIKIADTERGGRLAEARRRMFFTRQSSNRTLIHLANGRHFERFRKVPLMSEGYRMQLLRDLCQGIARLEDLPMIALQNERLEDGVPLRVTPRTPTKSAFWVIKPWHLFRIEAPLPYTAEGLEALHTHLRLTYQYKNGGVETLEISLELFDALLDLKDGVQMSGISQEGLFSNLEVFTQRLARENARDLHGWHPDEEHKVFRIRVEPINGRQVLVREAI